jgi:hypothetical protein
MGGIYRSVTAVIDLDFVAEYVPLGHLATFLAKSQRFIYCTKCILKEDDSRLDISGRWHGGGGKQKQVQGVISAGRSVC